MEPLFAFMLGPTELCIFGVIVVLLFGHRLPAAMRGMGEGLKGFKEGLNDTADVRAGSQAPAANAKEVC